MEDGEARRDGESAAEAEEVRENNTPVGLSWPLPLCKRVGALLALPLGHNEGAPLPVGAAGVALLLTIMLAEARLVPVPPLAATASGVPVCGTLGIGVTVPNWGDAEGICEARGETEAGAVDTGDGDDALLDSPEPLAAPIVALGMPGVGVSSCEAPPEGDVRAVDNAVGDGGSVGGGEGEAATLLLGAATVAVTTPDCCEVSEGARDADPPRIEALGTALPLIASEAREEGVALPPLAAALAEGLPETWPVGEAPRLENGVPETGALGVPAAAVPVLHIEGSGEIDTLRLTLGDLLFAGLELLLTDARGDAVEEAERVKV